MQAIFQGTGGRLSALPIRRADVTVAASAIPVQLKRGDTQGALRALIQLNDSWGSEHGLRHGVLGISEPKPTRDRAWDAALAELAAWRLTEENIPLATWVDKARYFLPLPRSLHLDSADPIPDASNIPHEFSRRGILVWSDTFESV